LQGRDDEVDGFSYAFALRAHGTGHAGVFALMRSTISRVDATSMRSVRGCAAR